MNQKNKHTGNFIVNNLLLLSGLATIVSGLVLQIGFHIGSAEENHMQKPDNHAADIEQLRVIDLNSTVWGIDYETWSIIHKIVIIFFSLAMTYHFTSHRKWYKGVFTRKLISKNKQLITLSVLFILVALTGFVPWFIYLSDSNNILRLALIEIHDKLAIFLIVFLILHVIKRAKWFPAAFKKLKK